MIVVAIIGILAAIAIPSFIKFQARAKQSEVKANLKGIFTLQKSRFQEFGRYSTDVSVIGFAPHRNNRYSYNLDGTSADLYGRATETETQPPNATGVEVDTLKFATAAAQPVWVPSTVQGTFDASTSLTPCTQVGGIYGACPFCGFSAQAAGNVDNDSTIDSWYVSSETAASAAENCSGAVRNVPGGEPMNTNNDVDC